MVAQHFLDSYLYWQFSRSKICVSTVTFSRGEKTVKKDYEKWPESMDGDVGHNARTTQFLRQIYRPLRTVDSITLASSRNGIPSSRYSSFLRPGASDRTKTKM